MKRFFSGLFAALVVVLSAAPFLYVFVRSFLSPGGVTFQYYYDVFLASPKYLFRFWKSIGMAVCIAAGQLLISVFAGFGFAKYKFPGRNFLFFLLMILMTLPVQVTLVPDFIMLGYMNLLNTYAALILPSIIVPLGTFILTQSFKSVPDTVLDAAMLDGCGVLRMLFYVVSPMNKSGLVCVLLLSFLDAWNMVEQPIAFFGKKPSSTPSRWRSPIHRRARHPCSSSAAFWSCCPRCSSSPSSTASLWKASFSGGEVI